jgi:hypothetical protein
MNEDHSDSTYWKLYFTDFSGSTGGTYYFTQKQLGGTSIIDAAKETAMFDVYPNPARNLLNLVYDATQNGTIRIFNMAGALVYQQQINFNGFGNQSVNISNLPSGLYTLNLETRDGVQVRKIIKE